MSAVKPHANIKAVEEETTYNFLTERKLLKRFTAYYVYKSPLRRDILYSAYVAMVVLFMFLITASSLAAVYVSLGDTIETIHTLHMFILNICILAGLFLKHVCNKQLSEFVEILEQDVYRYDGEPVDQHHIQMRRNCANRIRHTCISFGRFLYFSGVCNILYVSGSQLFLNTEDSTSKPINPYLPEPFYLPFDTRNTHGFGVALFLNVLHMLYLCSIFIVMDEIYMSCAVQLTGQFEILNDSIKKIEKRAVLKLAQTEGMILAESSMSELYLTQKFHKCLNDCIRANIQHHHEIIKLMNKFNWYGGASILILELSASLAMAMQVVLILKNPGFHLILNFAVTLSSELMYVLHYCWFGEQLTQESRKTYNILFWTPWAHCSKEFKQLLIIMMLYTGNPVKINTVKFGISASLETFGSIISSMYQIVNVARGFNE